MDTEFDVIVIGAGVNGSCAALSLAKRGKKTLLLEQFPLPHTRGSSHGQSRIIRLTYEDLLYAQMTRDSYPEWRQLEKETGQQLLIQNGMLQICDENSDCVQRTLDVLQAVNADHRCLSPSELRKMMPLFDIPDDCIGIHEPGGGTLLASKCVLALQRVFMERGGKLRDGEQVVKIEPGQSSVTVTTSKGNYRAKGLIITAGAWTGPMAMQLNLKLPLQPTGVHVCYYKLENPEMGTIENFPSFVRRDSDDIYGLAAYEYPGLVKICNHYGEKIDPDLRNDEPDLENLRYFINKFMTGVECTPSIVEKCIYTMTPDKHQIIDRHPLYPNIAIGAGFCGSGFKMAPITGKILADMVLNEEIAYDISMLSMSRFKDVVTVKSSL